MACIHYVTSQTLLPGGGALLAGKITPGTYAAGGCPLNLSNYFEVGSEPTVMLTGDLQAANKAFGLGINISNAETMAVKVFVPMASNGAGVDYMAEANAGMVIGVNVGFMAFGQTH